MDLEQLKDNAIIVSSYKAGDRSQFDRVNPWSRTQPSQPLRDHYRVIWRSMAAPTENVR